MKARSGLEKKCKVDSIFVNLFLPWQPNFYPHNKITEQPQITNDPLATKIYH